MAHHDSIEYPQAQHDPSISVFEFTAEELKEIDRHIAKYPDKTSAVMPALWIAQEKYGWLSQGAMQLVADTLGLSFAHVYGVATFYTMYLKENRARHLLEVCTCFSCGVCNGQELYEWTCKYLQANESGVSADGKIYIREAECLGACDTAPVVQVDNRRMRFNVDEAKMKQIVEALRNDEPFEYEPLPLMPPGSAD